MMMGQDLEIQEDTDEQVQDQEDLDLTEEEDDPDTADIQIEEDTEDADSEGSELTSEEALFSDSPVEEELFTDAVGEEADSYLGVRTQPIIYDDFAEDLWAAVPAKRTAGRGIYRHLSMACMAGCP